MIDFSPRRDVTPHSVVRVLTLAGCRVDLAIVEMTDRAGASAAAVRLAEQLVAERSGSERRAVRVAALPPAGRPVATVLGRKTTISVSLSHDAGLCGAAVCDGGGVGLDIVDAASVRKASDVWFTSDELSLMPDDGLLRARLWAAKEAAYKAARLDEGFRPRRVAIEGLWTSGFRWSVRGDHRLVRGAGTFFHGPHVIAVSVATESRVIVRASKERVS